VLTKDKVTQCITSFAIVKFLTAGNRIAKLP